ncbi:MAG: DUF4270 family protein [Bacteroidales bacterium]|nr:DUF4270 family protein [Bacteroidales bacterium]MBO7572743.1 DUF4270 family protein [Bacteroidales bacterium]
MNRIFNAKFLIVLALTAILAFATNACKDDDSAIGTGIMPNSDMMEFKCDTLGIQTFAVRDTHVETQNRTVNPIGIVNDEIFGQTNASCAFQVLLSSNNVQFNREIDTADLSGVKLTLQLKYDEIYGSAESSMKINVNRLLTSISYDSTYYDDTHFDASQYELLQSTDITADSDSIIKVEMPQNLVENIIRQNVGQTTWSNEDFVKFFKGIYVTTELNSGDGCLYALNLINSKSKMVLTYNDTCTFDFIIGEYAAKINLYSHDYTNADSELKDAIDNPEQPSKYCYIQGLAGMKTKIKFPELANMFDSTNIIINKAQLKVTIKEGTTTDYLPSPKAMSMTRILSSGLFDFLEDYKSNSKYFGGQFDASDNSYTFNIPLHLQSLQNGEPDNGIYLVANDNRIVPYRAMLYGGAHENYSVKILVYYSKY